MLCASKLNHYILTIQIYLIDTNEIKHHQRLIYFSYNYEKDNLENISLLIVKFKIKTICYDCIEFRGAEGWLVYETTVYL